MKGKTNRRVWLYVVGILLLLGWLALSAIKVRGKVFAWKFPSQLSLTNGSKVDFSQITNFDWEQVFIFCPYPQPAEIEKALGFKWSSSSVSEIRVQDWGNLIVFTSAGRVVASTMLGLGAADFPPDACRRAWSRENAKFIVTTNSEGRVVLFPFSVSKTPPSPPR